MTSTNLNDPYVLVFGAAGRTGQRLIDGLLRAGGLRVGAISRSASGPSMEKWKSQGIELRVLDVTADSEAKIVEALQGVDILLSVVSYEALEVQKPLFAAAAKVPGIKRIIPSDFSVLCPPGVTAIQDRKNAIHEHIHELGLPYTFIDVGWWKQLTFPYPPSFSGNFFVPFLYNFCGNGKTPVLVTDREVIGDFVGRIIKDERTLNKYVIVYEDEVTWEEVWRIAEQVSPEGAGIIAKKNQISREENLTQVEAARAAFVEDQCLQSALALTMAEYMQSIHFRGDNTLARAMEMGALDARALYPDVKTKTLLEYAREFYADPKDV